MNKILSINAARMEDSTQQPQANWTPRLSRREEFVQCLVSSVALGVVGSGYVLLRAEDSGLYALVSTTAVSIPLAFVCLWSLFSHRYRKTRQALMTVRRQLFVAEPMQDEQFVRNFEDPDAEHLLAARAAVARFFDLAPEQIVPKTVLHASGKVYVAAVIGRHVLAAFPGKDDFLVSTETECSMQHLIERLHRFTRGRRIDLSAAA